MHAEYFALQESCEKKYGENTIVLYEVGTFFDAYSYTREDGVVIGKAEVFSKICGLKLTCADSNRDHAINNPRLAGAPTGSFDRVCSVCEDAGYTVVKVEQVGEKGKGLMQRKVTYVTNKGVSFNHEKTTNNVICLVVQGEKVDLGNLNNLVTFGATSIDLSTGKSYIHEIHAQKYNPTASIAECYKFLLHLHPCEIILYLENIPEDYYEYLSKQLEIENFLIRFTRQDALKNSHKAFMDYEYRDQLLQRIFPISLSVRTDKEIGTPPVSKETGKRRDFVSDLGLERLNFGVISYCLLLDYCYSINEGLLKYLSIPTIYNQQTDHLLISYNAALQLHLINPKTQARKRCKSKPESVLQVIDYTLTPMGYRFLQERLLNPLANGEKLRQCYQLTELMIPHYSQVMEILKEVDDVEKYHRKFLLSTISPNHFGLLLKNYQCFLKIQSLIPTVVEGLAPSIKEDVTHCRELMEYYAKWLDLDKLEKYSPEENLESFILPGVNPTLDQNVNELRSYSEYLINVATFYQNMETKGSSRAPVVFDGNDISTTSARANAIQQIVGNTITLIHQKANRTCITSAQIDFAIEKLKENRKFVIATLATYLDAAQKMLREKEFHYRLHHHLAYLDFLGNNVKIMQTYKYFLPSLLEDKSSNPHLKCSSFPHLESSIHHLKASSFEMKELRHPLVERRIEAAYVTNDVSLGGEGNAKGMLIYGASTIGKSSILKAIGCIIVMAQAGMPVPAKLTYTPFRKLFTRITCADELLKGWSSYELEIRELNTILKQADDKSLVLADELSRGNSIDAGTAVVIATIKQLMDRGVIFISSSHLHHLVDHPIIYLLEEKKILRICHLMSYWQGDKLVLDRKLKEGKGDGSYGIEVAKSLGLSEEFISLAVSIRDDITKKGNLLSQKTSRYNTKVYVDSCSLCGEKNDLEVHHLQEQRKADADGIIGYMHKNVKNNLAVLCHRCHVEKASKLKWVETVTGLSLVVEEK